MTPYTESYIMLPDAKVVLSRDGESFILRTLTEAAAQSKALVDAGFQIVGAIAPVYGEIHGAAEYKCGPLIHRAIQALKLEEAKKPVPPLAWLENLWTLEDPRS